MRILTKPAMLILTALVLVTMLLAINGCGGNTTSTGPTHPPMTSPAATQPPTTAPTSTSPTAPATTPTVTPTQEPGLTSVYDGTYTGTFNYRYRTNESQGGGVIKAGEWQTARLTLQITFQTKKYWPNNPEEVLLGITQIAGDDPGFGVTSAAAPLSPSQAILPAHPPFSGPDAKLSGLSLYIEFPNGARLWAEGAITGDSGTSGAMSVAADGSTVASTTEKALRWVTWSAWNVPSGILSNWGKNAFIYRGEDDTKEMPPEGMEFSFDSWKLVKNRP